MHSHSVYCLQHTSGCVYIGKARNPVHRWNKHKYHARQGRQSHLYNAIRKYGENTFCLNVLETFETEDEAFGAEIFYIAYLRAVGATLYNHTLGGEGLRGISEATRAKMRRPKTLEHVEKIRRAKLGKIPNVSTYKLTPEIAFEIRNSPLSGRALAVLYDVAPSTISHVRTGKSWEI